LAGNVEQKSLHKIRRTIKIRRISRVNSGLTKSTGFLLKIRRTSLVPWYIPWYIPSWQRALSLLSGDSTSYSILAYSCKNPLLQHKLYKMGKTQMSKSCTSVCSLCNIPGFPANPTVSANAFDQKMGRDIVDR
jgi:hypothetical protein